MLTYGKMISMTRIHLLQDNHCEPGPVCVSVHVHCGCYCYCLSFTGRKVKSWLGTTA